jgi:hypothetical protein
MACALTVLLNCVAAAAAAAANGAAAGELALLALPWLGTLSFNHVGLGRARLHIQ